MKKILPFAIVAASLLSGCASTVMTYDAQGKLIGSCASKINFGGGGASCTGRSNGETKDSLH